jgi:hypothetical protein
MNGLTGMIMGSGRVKLLSGRILLNGSGFGSATRCAPASPLGHDAGHLGHAGRVHAVRPAGPLRRFGPNAEFKQEIIFLFQIYFINYKSI